MSRIVVFTDLDGTLLDHDTYSVRGAVSTLDLLARRDVDVVPVTSKAMNTPIAAPVPTGRIITFTKTSTARWPASVARFSSKAANAPASVPQPPQRIIADT